jgi:hypothetical protein
MKIGSESHKQLFCQSFLDSYQEYDPPQLPWPKLDNDALALLRSIPFWREALTVEIRAGGMVTAFAETISDRLLREAIALQGKEETRHAQLLDTMMAEYGIELERPHPDIPKDLKTGFTDLGHEECLDSFFAFGLFKLAHQAQVFPEAMFSIFEPILDEEARHIVFFANWMAYTQIQEGQGVGIVRGTKSLWFYARAVKRLLSSFTQGNSQSGPGFTVGGASAFPFEITAESFLATCLNENARRMGKFDQRLLRPTLIPALAAVAFNTVKLLPKKQTATMQSANLS